MYVGLQNNITALVTINTLFLLFRLCNVSYITLALASAKHSKYSCYFIYYVTYVTSVFNIINFCYATLRNNLYTFLLKHQFLFRAIADVPSFPLSFILCLLHLNVNVLHYNVFTKAVKMKQQLAHSRLMHDIH